MAIQPSSAHSCRPNWQVNENVQTARTDLVQLIQLTSAVTRSPCVEGEAGTGQKAAASVLTREGNVYRKQSSSTSENYSRS